MIRAHRAVAKVVRVKMMK